MKPRVLCLDPGFAKLGWAIVSPRLARKPDRLRALGVLETEPAANKSKIRQADDNFRRWQLIAQFLGELIQLHNVRALTFEAQSPVRNSSSATKVGGVYAILATLAAIHQIPELSVFPKELKQIVRSDGKRSIGPVSKVDVENVCRKEFSGQKPIWLLSQNYPDGLHNHAWDALGSYLAVRHHAIIQSLRQ